MGVKATHTGLTEQHVALLQDLNRPSDVIMVTYYPLGSGFHVRPPAVIEEDLQALMDLYPERPIFLKEVGYPTSQTIGSSEEEQVQFVHEGFAAWDARPERVPLVNFTWMHDVSQAELDRYGSYHGTTDAHFLAFLASLGLRTSEGHHKKDGFQALREEAAVRGWSQWRLL